MKQMHKAWYLVVAVSVFTLFGESSIYADSVPVVPLSTSVTTYITAINAAVNKATFIDVYNACLPLSSAVSPGMTDLGAVIRDNWYRVTVQELSAISSGLTAAAIRLLQTYKIQNSAFADLYDNNPQFQITLLSVNDATRFPDPMRDPATKKVIDLSTPWGVFLSDATNDSFYNVFMGLRRRRDCFKAAIDPTTLATSTSYKTTEVQNPNSSINKLLTKPALPKGAPANGDMIAICVDMSGTRHYLQAVKSDDGVLLFATSTDPLDPAAQFKLATDYDRFGLQLTTGDGSYLSAQNVIGDPSWLPSKKQKATRLAFVGKTFTSASEVSGKFVLEPVSNGNGFVIKSAAFDPIPSTDLKSLIPVGYLKVALSGDLACRAVDPGAALIADNKFVPNQIADATVVSFIRLTDLHKNLGELRANQDVASRIAGYSTMLDGSLISTLDDFLLVVAEAQAYVDSCRTGAASWTAFTGSDGLKLMRALIQKFRQNMVTAPAGSDATAASGIFARQNNQISSLEVSLNAGMNLSSVGGRLPDGSPIKDNLVVIAAPNGMMMTAGESGIISLIPRDLVDPSAQFLAEVDPSGNVSFKSLVAGSKYLQAGLISANVSGWLAKARADISRVSCVRAQPGQAEKFTLEGQGPVVGTYAFKNLDSQGYLRADSDNFVRAVDAANTGASLPPIKSVQTAFTFVPVDSFIKKLSALRLEAQDKIRVDGYIALASEILTDQHVNLLLQEIDMFVSQAVASRTQWATWKSVGLDKTLLSWIPSGLLAYSDKSLYGTIQTKLTAGYAESVSVGNVSGLSAGDVIVLQSADQQASFIQVQPDGSCKMVTGSQYFLDPATQFIVVKKDASTPFIEFQSAFLNNLMFRAPDVAVPSNATEDFLMDRVALLSQARVDGPSDADAAFEMIPVRVPGKVAVTTLSEGIPFILKRKDKDGHLKVGTDLNVRFFDASTSSQLLPPASAAVATKVSYAVVNSLQKKFTQLRGLKDDAARVVGYRALLKSIVTLGDLKMLLLELKYYIEQPRVDVASYTSFKGVEIPITELFTQISTMFTNSLKQFDASVPTLDSLRKSFALQLVQNISGAFAQLPLAEKVGQLETLFMSVSNAGVAAQFLTLFDVTMVERALFSSDLLTRMKALHQALILNEFTKTDATIVAGGSKKRIDVWLETLNADVKFADVIVLLTPLVASIKDVAAATDDLKNRFVALSIRLTDLLQTASDDERESAAATLELAAYTYLYDRKASLVNVITAIRGYVKPQNVPATYSSQLDALIASLKALTQTSSPSGMEQFIVDAKKMVDQRAQALDVDLDRLRGVLDDALWHPLVLNQAAVSGGAVRYDAQLSALLAVMKAPIPFLDLIKNLTDMLDKNVTFADSDIAYFMARATQLVNQKGGQKDGGAIDSAITVLTRGGRYQVNSKRQQLDQLILQLIGFKASLTGSTEKTYIQKLNDLKSLLTALDTQAASKDLSETDVQGFFDSLQNLVDARLDATPSQLDNLTMWLSSSVVNTSRLVFSKSDGVALIKKMLSVLQSSASISDRVGNLQLMLRNHPQFSDQQLKLDFIEKARDLTTVDARQQAASEKFDIRAVLGQLLTFAKANQFAGDATPTTGTQVLDKINAQLSVTLNQVLNAAVTSPGDLNKLLARFSALNFVTQVSELDRAVSEVVDKATASAFSSFAGIVVANRISGKEADVNRLKKVLQSAQRAPGIADDSTKQVYAKLEAALVLLDQPLLFSDYFNAINVLVSTFPDDFSKIPDESKNLLVGYAQKLADNLISSTDQNIRNTADALLKKLAFNQLSDRSTELLKICDIIEAYVPSEQVGKKYTQAILALLGQIDKVTSANLSSTIATLTDLVNRRSEGIDSDISSLKQAIDKLIWHPLVQGESGQIKLKALNALQVLLNQPIPVTDLINLLSLRLKNPSFAPDDVTYFFNKAQALVDQKNLIADKAVLTQAINLLNQASRYQMSSKRSDLDSMVAVLQTQEQSFTQQVYVSYGDRVEQIKIKLGEFDKKALAQQLSDEDATQFLKDLAALVNDRAQGIPANITELSSWLQGVLPQSRLFFVKKGAKDKAIALLAILQQPVPYADQYVFLSGLLRDYPHFSSDQMTTDFFDKCAYLVSEDGKKQAVSEGFDYKKLADVLLFARQNQVGNAKDKVDSLLTQLNASLAPGQTLPKTFNDRVAEQEAAITSLKESGSNLSDFVKALEGMVADRLFGNDVELTRLSQLLQKAQWNAVVRQSSQSSSLLSRIQTALDGLNKPLFFVDLSAHLLLVSKTSLTSLEDQERFVVNVKKLLDLKEQAPDGSSLDQIITALKIVAYNQLQKRTDLPQLITQLESYRSTITQQVYVSFAEQIEQVKSRLTALDAKAKAQQLSTDDSNAFLKDLGILVNSRSRGIAQDISKLAAWFADVVPQSRFFLVVTGAKDKAAAFLQVLQQSVPYIDQYNFVAGLIKDYSTFSSAQMITDFLNKCTYLSSEAGKKQAVAEGFDYKKLLDVLIFAEKNQLQASKEQIDALVAALNVPLITGQIAEKTFGDKLSEQEKNIQNLVDEGTKLSDFVTALEGLVAARLYANDSELTRLNQLLQRALWNGAIRKSTDLNKLLVRINAALEGLNKQLFFTDVAAYLLVASKLPLVSQDDQDRFIANVGKLTAIKEQAADPNALDQVITTVKVVAYNQLQKRPELAPLITQLDVYRGKMNQQEYISFADQITQIKDRLTSLDAKAKAQQLVEADATAFLKDLEALINARAQGVADDTAAITTWLQGVIPQSRLFFVTKGAKEKGAALLLLLQKPVSYADQYNYLAGLLHNYTTFSSEKMSADVLTKCSALVSDAGKKQAQAEGFDYNNLADLLTFAEQNQMLAYRDKVDELIKQLKMPLDGATVVVETFNDKLTKLETGVDGLSNPGANLADFIGKCEALVVARLDAVEAETARLTQLLQKIQWNAAIRKAANASVLLARIQTCLDNLIKPILFTDLSAYLTDLSKQPLVLPDEQNRFIARATHLVKVKDQATDASAIDQIITVFKLVAYNQLQKRTEMPMLIDQLSGYKDQMGKQTILSFAQQIADLNNRVNGLTAATADKFIADLTAVVKGRFEASTDQLKTLADLVSQVSWLNVVRSDKTKGYVKIVADLIKEVARVPSFAERVQDLMAMIAGTETLNDVLQDSFVQKAQQLLSVKSNATSSQLVSVIQALQVAIFNQVKDRAQELQDILNTFVKHQQNVQLTGGLSFGDRVKQLQQRLPALTEQALPDFRQQVSDLFDSRVDAADEDIVQFKQLLQAAAWNNVVVTLKSRGNSAASDDFSTWYNTVDAPIDFSVWQRSLSQMLQADVLPDVLQQQFMRKVTKLLAAIPRAKPQDLDDSQKLLLQASYNQLSRYKSELDLAVGKLKDASRSQTPQSQLSYAERIKALKDRLGAMSKASTQDDVDVFIKMVTDLVDQRVDAINDDISVLQKWLMSNDVQNNEAIYFRQGGEPLMKLASTLANVVGYGIRVQNLMSLVQNNNTFTDILKSVVLAKIQILVDQRAQAATENFALSDVVKIVQFVIDRRLEKTADAVLISKLNNAIYVLQSGSTGALRLRYGQQFDQVKTMLAALVAADIPKFVSAVKALVDSRVDGTADQVAALRDWLLGSDVQANKVLFFAPQKADLQKYAATLLTLPNYADRYTNLRQLLQDYPVLDNADIIKEFLDKAFLLVNERGRAVGEKFDLQYVKDLFVFALQNRLTNDATSSTTLRQYMDALDKPADQAVATGASVPYAQRITDLQAKFRTTTQANFNEFVSLLSQAITLRVDATDSEITTIKAWLLSSDVQNSKVIFLQGGLAQVKPLIDKLDEAITFAQRVDNLRVMIQNTSQFTSTDQMTFFAKVDKLIAERWRAAQENYDLEIVVKLLQYVQTNQFSAEDAAAQSNLITTKITSLRTAPEQQGPVVQYLSFAERVTNLQKRFAQIGSMQKDIAVMKQFIKDIDQMVADRVDGSDTDRATLVTFIRSKALYHQLVYGVAEFETAFKNHINGLLAPLTYGEMYTNFKKLLTVSVYSDQHKAVFIRKLQALVDGRGEAQKSGVDLDQLGRDITFAKLNKFNQEILDDQARVAPDRNPTLKQIEDLTAQLQVAPLATLTAAIAKVQAEMNSASAENWAAANAEQKRGLLSRLRVLANNVDETASQQDRDAIDIMLVTARARVFKGDTDAVNQLNEHRAQVQKYGATSSGVAAVGA